MSESTLSVKDLRRGQTALIRYVAAGAANNALVGSTGALFLLSLGASPFHLGLLVRSQAFTAAYSPDGQVAMKTAAFWSKTILGHFFIDLLLECPEQVLSLSNTNPERPWALLTGKRSQTNTLNLQRIPIGHCQTDCTADAGKFRFRDISQEFQRQMHVLPTSPVDSCQARCKFIFE